MADASATNDERRIVLKKIDRRLLPVLGGIYMLQYIDKSSMSYAAVFNFRKDIGLKGGEYSWLGTVFYIGYTVFEFPGVFLMQKCRTTLFLGILIIVWGALLMGMAGPRNFAGIAALRTLLGAAESMVTPGFALITARFYTRREQPFRVAVWYCCNALGNFFGGLFAYGVGQIYGTSIPNWAYIFLLNGIITLLGGMAFLWLCPNSPESASFLDLKERTIALNRVRLNQSSLSGPVFKWAQAREAFNPLQDPQGWLLFLAVFGLSICNGGLGNYFHLILVAYGFGSLDSILLGLPTAVLQIIGVLAVGFVAEHVSNSRLIAGSISVTFSVIAMSILYTVRSTGGRLFGYYLVVGFIPALGQLFALPSSNVNGYTKRIIVNAMVFLAYGGGNALGPTFWVGGETPPYRAGVLACLICFISSCGIMLGLRTYYVWENKRRDRMYPNEKPSLHFEDVTDIENKAFRYVM